MALADIGVKIKVEGEKTFATAMRALNQETKALQAEMKSAITQMDGLGNSEQANQAKIKALSGLVDTQKQKLDVLGQQYEKATTRLDELGKELEDAKNAEGDNSAEVQKLTNQYNKQSAEVSKLRTQMADANRVLNDAEKELKDVTSATSKWVKASSKLDTVSKKLSSAGKTLSSLGSTLTKSVTAPLVAAGAAAVKLASDYEENLNKVEASFKDNAQEVKAWAKTATDSFGMSESAALEATSLFGDMGTSMGLSTKAAAEMSIQLAGLAGDLASFKNIDIEQAMTALKGVFTGETESLKTLGVVMTETNLKQFASDMGLVWDSMSQAEKVTLRYQYVLANTTNAQGDYLRTSDGTANSLRTLKSSVENLGAAFGQELLPAVTPVINKLTDVVKELGKTDDATKQNVVKWGLLAAAVGPATSAIGKTTEGLAKLTTTASKAAKSIGEAGGVSAAIGNMGTAASVATPLIAGLAAGIGLWAAKQKELADAGVGKAAESIEEAADQVDYWRKKLDAADSSWKSSLFLNWLTGRSALKALKLWDADDMEKATKGLAKAEEQLNDFRKSSEETNKVLEKLSKGEMSLKKAADVLGVSQSTLRQEMAAMNKEAGNTAALEAQAQAEAEAAAEAEALAEAEKAAAEAAAEAHKKVVDIASAAIDAKYSSDDLRASYNELSSELESVRDEADETTVALAEQKLAELNLQATNQELATSFKAMGIDAGDNLSKISKTLIDAGIDAQTYASDIASMRDSVVNSFQRIKNENALTADEMTQILAENLEVQRNWGYNLAALWAQAKDDTVRAYINYLYEQGPQYAAAVQEFANGGYAKLEEQAYLWADAGKLSTEQYAAGIEMKQYLANSAGEDVADSAIDGLESVNAKTPGKNTGKDYASGLGNVSANKEGQTLANSAVTGLKSTASAYKAAASGLAQNAVAMLKAAAPAYQAAGSALGRSLATGIQSSAASATSAAAAIGSTIVRGLSANVAAARSAGSALGSYAVAGFRSYNFSSAGRTAGSQLAQGIGAAASTARSYGYAVARAGLSGASNVGGWYSVGYNMARGIANGIYGGSSAIRSAAVNAAYYAYIAAKRYLGINSPSRLFRDKIGMGISEGIAVGIEKGQPEINDALKSMTNTSLNTVHTGQFAGGTTNNAYSVAPTIYIYGAEGQSVDALAAAVEEKLNNSLIRGL